MSNLLLACNNTNTQSVVDFTKVSRTVTINDKDALYNELISYINGSATPSNFQFNTDDIINTDNVNNYYFFNGSVYIQIDTYMYRFQLDKENVVSYIKYSLEA